MASANGFNLVGARIEERTLGAWIARLDVDSEQELDAAVAIEIDGVAWSGTLVRGELDAGRFRCTVVGGAGGLQAAVPALWYSAGPSFRLLLSDALRLGGEALSGDVDGAILSRSLPAYQRAEGVVGEAVAALVRRIPGATYRILRDGTMWVGVDDFPELATRDVDIETDPMPAHGRVEIAPESPVVYPGVTYGGRCVSEVVTILEGTKLRQELVCTSAGAPSEPFEAQLGRRIENRLDYTRVYTAKVLRQSGGKVDVMPDDSRMRGQGITGVPLRLGMPGVEVSFPPGAQVLLGWENDDPSKPYASLWLMGAALASMTITGNVEIKGDLRVTGEASALAVSADLEVTANAITPATKVSLSKHAHDASPIPTRLPLPGI